MGSTQAQTLLPLPRPNPPTSVRPRGPADPQYHQPQYTTDPIRPPTPSRPRANTNEPRLPFDPPRMVPPPRLFTASQLKAPGISGRVGSVQVRSGRPGCGRVRSGGVASGRVGSGRVGSGRVGSGQVGSGRVRFTKGYPNEIDKTHIHNHRTPLLRGTRGEKRPLLVGRSARSKSHAGHPAAPQHSPHQLRLHPQQRAVVRKTSGAAALQPEGQLRA